MPVFVKSYITKKGKTVKAHKRKSIIKIYRKWEAQQSSEPIAYGDNRPTSQKRRSTLYFNQLINEIHSRNMNLYKTIQKLGNLPVSRKAESKKRFVG